MYINRHTGVPRLRRAPVMVALVAVGLVLTACGSTDEASRGGDSVQDSSYMASATELVAAASGEVPFPELEPVPAAPGQKLFVISPSQSLEGNARMAQGAIDAAKAIGWETVLVDAQFDPVKEAAGVQRAVSEKADAIVLVAMNAAPIISAVKAARQAGLPVVSIVSGNAEGAEVDYDVTFDQHRSGEIAASEMINVARGKVHAIVMDDTAQPLVKPIVDGVTATLKACATCTIEQTVNFVSSQVGPDLTSLVQSALARHPKTNYIFTPYGAVAVFAAKAVKNVSSKAEIVSTASDLVNYDLIRQGHVQVASVDQPAAYDGYLAVYEVNRIIQGKKILDVEVPIKLITKKNAPSEGQAWEGDSEFVPLFSAAFGLS